MYNIPLFSWMILLCLPSQLFAQLTNIMLVGQYHNQDITNWVMSEKLDGVRAYWDGKQLISRQGYSFSPPDYFIQYFPPFAVDGELFSERNKFDEISAIVRRGQVKGWYKLKLHVFDVPHAKGDLFQRLRVLEDYLLAHPTPYIQVIPQIVIQDKKHLEQFSQHILKLGGEGVIVRNPKADYIQGRSSQILKVKPLFDEECIVIAHHKGKGKYKDKLGSISCENQRGIFRIGSGFSDKARANPPAIGTVISYKFRGITAQGKPRFATYWRIRSDLIETQ